MKSSFVEHIAASRINPVFEGSISMGRQAGTTVGLRSVAVGNNAVATGNYSGAIGNYTVAGGNGAVAVGNKSEASGNNSFASGEQTIANHRSQVAFGEYNIQDPNTTYSGRGTYVEIVGNGTSNSARSNARTLDWNGNEVLAGKLTVGTAPTNDMDAATKKYVDDAVESVDPAGCQEAAAAANAAATAANTAATEASRVNANVTKSGHTVSITTTNKSNVTTTKTIVEPTITVTQGSGDYDLSVTTSDGTQTVTIPNPNKELSDRAHVETVSRSKTRTGNPIQIEDAVNEIADKTVIKLVPKQDLHGYSRPWVGGAGKNLIDTYVKTEGGIAVTKSGFYTKFSGQATGSPTGIAVHAISSENGKSYIFSAKKISGTCSNASGIRIGWRTYKNGTEVYRSTNAWWNMSNDHILTIDVTSDCDTLGIYYFFSQGDTATDLTIAPMLRLASITDDTWEPYENLCPISGYDTVNLMRRGNGNLFNGVFTDNKYITSGGSTASIQSGYKAATDYIPVKENTAYTISGIGVNNRVSNADPAASKVTFYNSSKTVVTGMPQSDGYTTNTFTFTTPAGTAYIKFHCGIGATDVVVNEGSKSEFAHYPIAVSLATNGNQTAGTVYSGTVTLLADGSGQVKVDKKSFLFDGSSSAAVMNVVNDRALYYDTSTTIPLSNYSTDYICDYSAPNTATSNTDALGTYVYSNRFRIRCPESWGTTLETLNAKLAENPVRIVCPLTTPEIYTLTANQVKTLLGYNYIYTDGAEIALTYRQESLATNETLLKLLPTGSASGNPVSFSDGADDVPLKQLVVNVQPNQDLHGYEKPWVAGAGKNLANPAEFVQGGISGSNGGDSTATTRVRTGYIPVSASTAYVASIESDKAVLSVWFYTSSKSWISPSVTTASFTTPSTAAFVRIVMYKSSGADILPSEVTAFQLEKGSTATAWVPYENICPIRGWDSVPLLRISKNLIYMATLHHSYANASTGKLNATSQASGSVSYYLETKYLPNQITFNATNGNRAYVCYMNDTPANEVQCYGIDQTSQTLPKTVTVDKTYKYIHIQFSYNQAITNPQIEPGSTATAYEAPIAHTYDISIPSEAGTVYGCQIVLDENGEGELTVDTAIGTITGCSGVGTSSIAGSTGKYANLTGIGVAPLIDNTKATISFDRIGSVSFNDRGAAWYGFVSNTTTIGCFVPSDMTTEQVSAILTGTQFVVKIANPVTYSLTADQVKTLLGTNIISSDAGNVSVKYFKVLGEEQDLTPYAPKSNPTFTGSIKIGNTTLTEAKLQTLLSLAAGGLNGTTWLFNTTLNAPSQEITIGNASGLFVFGGSSSSGTQYTLAVDEYHDDTRLRYYDDYGDSTVYSTGQWMDQLCRTITFTADVDTATPSVQAFLDWLNANATRQ